MFHKSLIPMAILLPVWLVLGRALFSNFGWLSIIYLFTIAPLIFIGLLTVFFLAHNVTIDAIDKGLLVGLYMGLLLHGIFVVDGGDTQSSVGSIATNVLGNSFQNASALIAFLLLAVSLLLLITLVVRLIVRRVQRRHHLL